MNEVTVTFVAVGRRANTNFSYLGVEFVDGRATVTGHPRRIRRLERRMRFRRAYRSDSARVIAWAERNGVDLNAKNTNTKENKPGPKAVEVERDDNRHVDAPEETTDNREGTSDESAASSVRSEELPEGVGDEALESGNTKLKSVIQNLDPDNDKDWTATGLPSMSAIEKDYGSTDITRRDVKEALPGWNRDKAKQVNSEVK